MGEDPKLGALRKGFLEFLVLRIISGSTVYAADILKKLGTTDFATQEGTLYPLLSRLRREGLLDLRFRRPRKAFAARLLHTLARNKLRSPISDHQLLGRGHEGYRLPGERGCYNEGVTRVLRTDFRAG